MNDSLNNKKITKDIFINDDAVSLTEKERRNKRFKRMRTLYYSYVSDLDQAFSISEKLVENAKIVYDNFDDFFNEHQYEILNAFYDTTLYPDSMVEYGGYYKKECPSVFPAEFAQWSKRLYNLCNGELPESKVIAKELLEDLIWLRKFIKEYFIHDYYEAWYHLYRQKVEKKVKKSIRSVISDL